MPCQHAFSFLPYDGVFEAQLGGCFTHLFLKPSLRSDQIFDELRNPPDRGVSVQPVQTLSQILWDSQRQVRRTWMETIHNRQLNHLHGLIISFTYTNRHKMKQVKKGKEMLLPKRSVKLIAGVCSVTEPKGLPLLSHLERKCKNRKIQIILKLKAAFKKYGLTKVSHK